MEKARLTTRRGESVECGLCAHRCTIAEGRRGLCKVRENRGGELYTLVYGRLVAENIDPVEKKPLFHFCPGSLSYSISTRGCNFRCLHCQNSSISQVAKDEDPSRFCIEKTPAEVVAKAAAAGCRSISYTYVEPTVFFEFAYDCCELALKRSIANIFVSNGYMSEEATRMLAPLLAGINIDVKSFRDEFYQRVCGARLQPVLDTVELMYRLGVWVEITTLIIPGHNDSDVELRDIASFIASLDPTIPWHVTAFHPTFKMTDESFTPASTLMRAREIGLDAGLSFVYQGNIPGTGGENTCCPGCGKEVVRRRGFAIVDNLLEDGVCRYCATRLPGIWS